jgi:hypothetical protein
MKRLLLLVSAALVATWLVTASVVVAAPLVVNPLGAYELVTPVNKRGVTVNPLYTVQASPDGVRAMYASTGALGDAPTASVLGGQYLATRQSAYSWRTSSVDAPQANSLDQIELTSQAHSLDLSRTLQVSRAALTPGATQGDGNLYLHDNVTGARTLVASVPGYAFYGGFTTPGAKALVDQNNSLTTFAFVSPLPLTPDAPPGVSNLFAYQDGQLRLVNYLPDGSPVPAGGLGAPTEPGLEPHSISSDGSRIYFTAADTGALYVRVNDTVTVPVSVSRRAGEEGEVRNGEFVAASDDGNILFFKSRDPLTNDSRASNGSRDLYRLDVTSGQLSDLTVGLDPADTNGGQVRGILGVSGSGDRVYFVAQSKLTADGVSGGANLYLWHNGTTTLVASLEPGGNEAGRPSAAVASPDGRYFAFASYTPVTGYDNTSTVTRCPAGNGANPDGGCNEVFVYDAVGDELTCASCVIGSAPTGHSTMVFRAARVGMTLQREVLDDGTVFFTTPERLVPQDSNGINDVYAVRNGDVELISSGTGSYPASFADATPDGSSVFFYTRQAMVDEDNDTNIDIYVLRRGEAPEPLATPPLSCEGDGCQGPLGEPAGGLAAVGSSVFAGSGNGVEPSVRSATGGRLSVSGVVRGSGATVSVRVPAGGVVRLSGASVRTVSRTVGKAGSVKLAVRLTGKAKRTLTKSRRLRAAVRVSFTPKAGKASVKSLVLSFRHAGVKGGRS